MLEQIEAFEEADEPLVVFSDHVAPVKEAGSREGWATILGGDNPEKRAEVVKAFQAGELKGLAVSIRAGGEGITLTRAHHGLFVDYHWTPAKVAQAEDRLVRIGSEAQKVQFTLLIADHEMDARVSEIVRAKSALFAATIQATTDGKGAKGLESLVEKVEKNQKNLAPPEPKKAKVKGETIKCAGCGKEVEVKVAGPKAKNPGRKFAKCYACGKFQWADGKGISEEVKTWTLKALQALAGVCDGAVAKDGMGFNGPDSDFGRDLAYREFLTDKQAEIAYEMLTKYKKQLTAYGLWPRPAL
jgi:hypothetical protein